MTKADAAVAFSFNGRVLGAIPSDKAQKHVLGEPIETTMDLIGSTQVQATYYYIGDKMVAVAGEFPSTDYTGVMKFFVQDYGDPKTIENPKESLYSGIEVENERAEWDLENGQFRLEKYSLTTSSGLFFACTREWVEQLAVEDAEDDLTQLQPEDEP